MKAFAAGCQLALILSLFSLSVFGQIPTDWMVIIHKCLTR